MELAKRLDFPDLCNFICQISVLHASKKMVLLHHFSHLPLEKTLPAITLPSHFSIVLCPRPESIGYFVTFSIRQILSLPQAWFKDRIAQGEKKLRKSLNFDLKKAPPTWAGETLSGALLRLKPSRFCDSVNLLFAPRHANLFIYTALPCIPGRVYWHLQHGVGQKKATTTKVVARPPVVRTGALSIIFLLFMQSLVSVLRL